MRGAAHSQSVMTAPIPISGSAARRKRSWTRQRPNRPRSQQHCVGGTSVATEEPEPARKCGTMVAGNRLKPEAGCAANLGAIMQSTGQIASRHIRHRSNQLSSLSAAAVPGCDSRPSLRQISRRRSAGPPSATQRYGASGHGPRRERARIGPSSRPAMTGRISGCSRGSRPR